MELSEREDARGPRGTIDLQPAGYYYRREGREMKFCDHPLCIGCAIGERLSL